MTAFKQWICDKFARQEVDPVISESDVQHMIDVREASERRVQRRQDAYPNWIEAELLSREARKRRSGNA